jgi:hypothetical protein
VLNVEPVSESVGVGDDVADTGFISGVDFEPIATSFALNVDPPSIDLEFMLDYDATFGDERAEDSVDDGLVPELSNKDKVMLQRALAEHAPEVSDYRNLSHAHRVVANGLQFNDSVSLINHDNVIIR